MGDPLDTLPSRPLTVEEVRVLNDASSLGALPYGWYQGERILTFLLVYDDRDPETETETTSESQSPDATGRSETDPIGEVEIFSPGGSDRETDDFRVYAVGFDSDAAAWQVLAELEPDAEFETVALTFREWTRQTYDDEFLDDVTVEPAEADDLKLDFDSESP